MSTPNPPPDEVIDEAIKAELANALASESPSVPMAPPPLEAGLRARLTAELREHGHVPIPASTHGRVGAGIGQAGTAIRGRTVKKAEGRREYKIVNERQESDRSWSYELHDSLSLTKWWVAGSDANYKLVEPSPLTPDQQAVATFVQAHLDAGPSGSVADWVKVGEDPNTHAFGASMGNYEVSAGAAYILWSGGAADCIIVAARGGSKGYLAHRDRQQPEISAIIRAINNLGPNPAVWLASGIFATADQAARSDLVRTTITELQQANLAIAGIYPTRQLALNTRTGDVLARFNPNSPKLTM